jgi:16S rRNA (cytidine1402-2'-O)-methyltransferase
MEELHGCYDSSVDEPLDPPGTLWIVATPIGSLEDLGPRARRILAAVEIILAEDTRVTRVLLGHAGVAAGRRLCSFHDHNERQRLPWVIEKLREGRSVALVSDAGTPALSDPGFGLVREARAAGIPICSVPGPSAFTAALAASGQPPLPAVLAGFLPPQRAGRRRRIAELGAFRGTVVVLLSPHRLAAELADLAAGLGPARPATLLAELSKRHERALAGTLGELVRCSECEAPRGEYVAVIGPAAVAPVRESAAAEVRAAYEDAVARGLDRREALRETARRLGLGRREVFASLLGDERGDGGDERDLQRPPRERGARRTRG